jgi:O-acetylhomoserine (thiol)-lyase
MKFETLQVHAGQEVDKASHSRAVPIYQTASYVFENSDDGAELFGLKKFGNIYSRITNPTTEVFEKRVAALEKGVGALATASGAAAVTYSILNILKSGQNIVASNSLYGGTYNLFAHTLPSYGITTKFVNSDDVLNFERAIDENTRAIYIESLGNPNSNIIDISKVSEIAHKNNIPLLIDNTFATPYLLRPIEFGADIVIHSATKFIGGHGSSVGGIIIDSGNFDWKKSGKFPQFTEPDSSYHGIVLSEAFGNLAYILRARLILLRDVGACLSPFNSFLFIQGLESLSLRVERHSENAEKVAEYLLKSPYIEKVNYPYLSTDKYHSLYKKYFDKHCGSIFTFEIKGDLNQTKKFVDSLKLFSNLANVADAKSLVIHPASTTHSQLTEKELSECGIKVNTIRLSIGIENIEDILADLDQAFNKYRENVNN